MDIAALLPKSKAFARAQESKEIERIEALCAEKENEVLAECKKRGVKKREAYPLMQSGQTLAQYQLAAGRWMVAADEFLKSRPSPQPAPQANPLARPGQAAATPPRLKLDPPAVTGNESWRPAVEVWEAAKISSESIMPVPPAKAPGAKISAEKEAITGTHDESYLEARITRLRFEIKRASGVTMKPFERTPPKSGRAYGRKALSYTDDSGRMWTYKHELQNHLNALLFNMEDKQLAARIRAENFLET